MGTSLKQKLQVTLKQHDVQRNHLISNPEFTDVTLVSSDDKIIEAHRIFLSSQSSFFKKIFKLKPERDIIIYLPNINNEELQSMVEYIYLGNTEIEEQNLENFFNVGKLLGVRGFEDVDMNSGMLEESGMDKIKESGYDGVDFSINVPKIQRQSNGKFSCDQCKFESVRRGEIKRHRDSVHLDVKYKCSECTIEYASKWQVKAHITSVHNGESYNCKLCEKKFIQPGTLNLHIRRDHKGLKSKCKECDGSFRNLAYHVKKEHRNITYPCDQCKYISKTSGNLKSHKNRKHGEKNNTKEMSLIGDIKTTFVNVKDESI